MRTMDFVNEYQATRSSHTGHCLLLLDAPTGVGKSFSVTRFLCERASQDPNFSAFFVTDKKANLQGQEFLDYWAVLRKAHPQLARRKIAFIRSLMDTVNLLLTLPLPKLLKADNGVVPAIEELKKQVRIYQFSVKNGAEQPNQEEVSKAEFQVRKEISRVLQDQLLQKEDEPLSTKEKQIKVCEALRNSKKDTPLSQWLDNIYPTIDLKKFQIYILTTDKWIRSYTPFFSNRGQAFIRDSLMKGALIVLDEFDSTKQRLQNSLLDNALTIKNDLIQLFLALDNGFKQVTETSPVAVRKVFEGDSRLEFFKRVAAELKLTYHLELNYKTRDTSQNENYVIHTPLTTLTSRSAGSKTYQRTEWHATHDSKNNLVWLADENTDELDELHLNLMIRRISGFIKKANRFIYACGRRYMDNYNQHLGKTESALSFTNAVLTLYDELNINNSDFIKMLLELDASIPVPKLKRTRQIERRGADSFYEKGLDVFRLEDGDNHNTKTRISASFLAVTPERYLLEVLQHCDVWGLSATAMLPTVLDNYDVSYLKARLGRRLIDGRQFLTRETLAEFNYHDRYQKSGINIEVATVPVEDSLLTMVDELAVKVTDECTKEIKKVEMQLNELLKPFNASSLAYFKSRYLGLFESFCRFLVAKNSSFFVGLQKRLPGETPKMATSFINEVFTRLSRFLLPEGYQSKLVIVAGNSPRTTTNQITGAMQYLNEGRTKLYLLSAYDTLGVGVNLKHPLTEIDQSNTVSIADDSYAADDARRAMKDADGIYLGDVTNILTTPQTNRLTPELLQHVFQMESMVAANELGPHDLMKRFERLKSGRPGLQKLRGLPSYVASVNRVVIQALGRMNRTFNKAREPLILINNELANKISLMGMPRDRFSPEFLAVVDYLELRDHSQEWQQQREINEKDNLTAQCAYEINRLVWQLQRDPETARQYRELRHFLLRYPSTDLADIKPYLQEMLGFQYLPNPKRQIAYPVTVNNLSRADFTFKLRESTIEISADQANLPAVLAYPGMRAFFEKQGYATAWEKKAYLLNPAQFINLYVGALGEVAGKFILEDIFGVNLLEIEDLANNELFDFKTTTHVLIDFKNWSLTHREQATLARKANLQKLETVQANSNSSWRVMIINLVGTNNLNNVVTVEKWGMEVAGLIDREGNCILTAADKERIGAYLFGSK